VINGTALPNEKAQRKSPDSSPDVPNPKRAKVDAVEGALVSSGGVDKAFKDLADKAKVHKAQDEQRNAHFRRTEDLTGEPVRVVKNPDAVMTSAYSQSLRDNANLLVMTKDARSLRPADKRISGDNHQESSSSQQVDYSDDGGYNEPGPPIVTKEQRDKSLKLWKDALIQAGNYLPKQSLSAHEHDMNIRFFVEIDASTSNW
jgi:hypothetical protein